MARQRQWAFSPNSGGAPIPEPVRRRTEARLAQYADEYFADCYTRLAIRFRAQFCYVDAYTEPGDPGPTWPPADGPETRDQYLERLRNTPLHLCRLRYFGDEERWGFGFFTYSGQRYELAFFPSGEYFGSPEEAFEVCANLYLSR